MKYFPVHGIPPGFGARIFKRFQDYLCINYIALKIYIQQYQAFATDVICLAATIYPDLERPNKQIPGGMSVRVKLANASLFARYKIAADAALRVRGL